MISFDTTVPGQNEMGNCVKNVIKINTNNQKMGDSNENKSIAELLCFWATHSGDLLRIESIALDELVEEMILTRSCDLLPPSLLAVLVWYSYSFYFFIIFLYPKCYLKKN